MNRSAPTLVQRTKAEQLASQNRWAARRWGSLVVLLLTGQVALGVVAIMLATGDSSVAVVPDYYQKSMKWDDEIAAKNASAALGWTVDLVPIDLNLPSAGLSVVVRDANAKPVLLRSATLRLYHHALANEVHEVHLDTSQTDGVLLQPSCFHRPGFWQVEVKLEDQAGHNYVDSRELNVTLTKAKKG